MLFAGRPQALRGGYIRHADEVQTLVNGAELLHERLVAGPDGEGFVKRPEGNP